MIQFGERKPSLLAPDCGRCEAMLTDALDGTLSAADQAVFDAHVAVCTVCSQMLADARRGAAWLELLRSPRPEPSADLMHRILARTSGAQALEANPLAAPAAPSLEVAPVAVPHPAFVPAELRPSNVLGFRIRAVNALRSSAQVLLQPRLAMTAAMAFFSIALTMNLIGVRLQDLRTSDLSASTLKRDFYAVDASAVRYYEGLRVVYELESRVHDLQSDSDADSAAGAEDAPPASAQPDDDSPAAPANPSAAPKADPQLNKKDRRSQPRSTPGAGTSRILAAKREGGLA